MTDLDLTASYSYTVDWGNGDGPETETITPKVKARTRNGVTLTSITGLAPLLADRIDAIAELGDRLHTLTVLQGATVGFTDEEEGQGEFAGGGVTSRDNGRLRTTYAGTRDLPIDVVLDLGERLRAQLGA